VRTGGLDENGIAGDHDHSASGLCKFGNLELAVTLSAEDGNAGVGSNYQAICGWDKDNKGRTSRNGQQESSKNGCEEARHGG
jgi:hypothetical protein